MIGKILQLQPGTRLIGCADVMVSVSSNDSLPNCMLETMACGVPVMMSDIPQIHEWIVDGVNGYLCSPRDPDVLTEKIRNIFKNENNVVVTFVKQNLIRVSQDANFS